MSWDVQVNAAGAPPPVVAEMPGDWQGIPLGSAAAVRDKISAALPGIEWKEAGSWGSYSFGNLSSEFNLGEEDPVEGLMVHVYGAGDPVQILRDLASRFDWYLLDISAGEWMHHMPDPNSGWESFQGYLDQIVRDSQTDTGSAGQDMIAKFKAWLFE
jgi:hypothetical protein